MKYNTVQIAFPRLYSNRLVSLFREFEEDALGLVVSERQCRLWVKSTIGTGSIFWTFESAVSHGNIFTAELFREVPLWKTMSISTRDQKRARTYFWIPKPVRFSFTQESNCLSPGLRTNSAACVVLLEDLNKFNIAKRELSRRLEKHDYLYVELSRRSTYGENDCRCAWKQNLLNGLWITNEKPQKILVNCDGALISR
jgi:hypothetical protein